MVGAGFTMLVFAAYALLLVMGEQLNDAPRLLAVFPWLIFLPYLANTTGWLLTELGRAPWAVYGLMKIEDAVSTTVSSGMVWVTLIGFTLVYGLLMVADVYLLQKFARYGAGEKAGDLQPEAIPSLVGD